MMITWLHDRSGVIGTKTFTRWAKSVLDGRAWNINIFLLAGSSQIHQSNCCVLTFITYNQIPRIFQSCRTIVRIKAYQAAPHNRRWVIGMNDGLGNWSSVRVGFMRGSYMVMAPFNNARKESKARRSFEFLSSLLNGISFQVFCP